MKTARVLSMLAAALVLIGVVVIFLQPGPPDAECVPDGHPSSGFVDEESGCAVSIESYNEIREHETGPKWFRIAGLFLILGGIGTGIAAVVVFVRARGSGSAPPAGEPSN